MWKKLSKTIILLFIATLLLTSCSNRNRELSSLEWIHQWNDDFCGPATIQMVMNYYFGKFEYQTEIYEQVRAHGWESGSDRFRLGQYLEKKRLYTSFIRFSDLKTIL